MHPIDPIPAAEAIPDTILDGSRFVGTGSFALALIAIPLCCAGRRSMQRGGESPDISATLWSARWLMNMEFQQQESISVATKNS